MLSSQLCAVPDDSEFFPLDSGVPAQHYARPPRPQRDSSHLTRSLSGGWKIVRCRRESIRSVLFSAWRFASRSRVRYLLVVLMLTWPNQFAMVLRSTPDRSK